MTLPTEKNTPGQNPLNKKTLIHGERKIGKSTLISKLYPEAMFIAADPTGLEELPVFQVPSGRGLSDWMEFRKIGAELAQGNDPFEAYVIDTVDELVRLCAEAVLGELPGGPAGKGYKHASDWDYGKGWHAITEEFRLRVAKLCSLGKPVVFVSHSKSRTDKDRTGREITRYSPDIGTGGVRDWLTGFVDYIFYAEVRPTDDGEVRLLRTMPSETYLAGARQPEGRPALPDPLPLDGKRLRAALLATAQDRPAEPGSPTALAEEEVRRDAEDSAQRTPPQPRKAKPKKPAKPKAAA